MIKPPPSFLHDLQTFCNTDVFQVNAAALSWTLSAFLQRKWSRRGIHLIQVIDLKVKCIFMMQEAKLHTRSRIDEKRIQKWISKLPFKNTITTQCSHLPRLTEHSSAQTLSNVSSLKHLSKFISSLFLPLSKGKDTTVPCQELLWKGLNKNGDTGTASGEGAADGQQE